MKNNITERTPFMTPDSLRKSLQMLSNFYDSHTKKNYGYTDINGSHYSGIVENHATELLLESRKLLMDKPALDNFIAKSSFVNYFNIEYSSLISTYEHQNTLVAVLKKDVLLNNKSYSIIFNNCDEKIILRSDSWSDPKVCRNKFYQTTTPPILVIHDNNDSVDDIYINLQISDGTSNDPIYEFFINETTKNFVNSYNEGTLTISPITSSMFDLPFIWINLSIFNLLPPIKLEGNDDVNSKSLLTIGTDGHNVSRLYPLIYGDSNTPDGSNINDWYIKIVPKTGQMFCNSMNVEDNYTTAISEIHFVKTDNIGNLPEIDHVINVENEFTQVILYKSDTLHWMFKAPTQGDYDYDGTTYINPIYGFISLSSFIDNINKDNKNLLSAFIIKFSDEYLHAYEYIDGDASSGVHVDTSSEYSDNGIDKKNGIIHGLGDFDGLPRYFSNLADRTIHRSHVELYSIRNRLNSTNQKYVDKQTSALIVDSSMPQKEIDDILNELSPIIKYKPKPVIPTLFDDIEAGAYYSDDTVTDLSSLNKLSDITFVDKNTFGNVNMPRYKLLPKFIYHGNRTFSLDTVAFDSELEKARAFNISNDNSYYENNIKSIYRKPDRTLARICDVPTSFVNLINIIDVSPTLILDEDYIRMNTSMTDNDINIIYNKLPQHVISENINSTKSNTKYLFDYNDNLSAIFPDDSSTMQSLKETVNINKSLDLIEDEHEFIISNSGTGYQIGDEFISVLGGLSYRGIIKSIDETSVTEIVFDDFNDDNRKINVGNLTNTSTVMKTTTITGNGDGLVITLMISKDVLDSISRYQDDYFDDIISFKYDNFNNVWINKFNVLDNAWEYDTQITGDIVINNNYDISTTDIKSRYLKASILKNIISLDRNFNSSMYTSPRDYISTSLLHKSDISNNISISDKTDYSELITDINTQDTFYVLQKDINESSDTLCVVSYEKFKPKYDNMNYSNQRVLPQFNSLNLSKYFDKSNTLSIDNTNSDNTQPSIYIYSPTRNSINNMEKVSSNVYKLLSTSNMTLMDIFYPNGIPYNSNGDMMSSPDSYLINPVTGILSTNVYSYNEYEMPNDKVAYLDYLNTLDRQGIIDIIISKYGMSSDPITFEGTSSSWNTQSLINYIMMNYYESPIYKHDDLKLMRTANDIVVKSDGNKYVGVGKQPSGSYISISNDIYEATLNINGKSVICNPEFIFSISDFPSDETLTKDFIIKDDNGIDISDKSIIIINDIGYMKNSKGDWYPIK